MCFCILCSIYDFATILARRLEEDRRVVFTGTVVRFCLTGDTTDCGFAWGDDSSSVVRNWIFGFLRGYCWWRNACENDFVFILSSLGESLRLLCSTCGPGWWALTFSR